MSNLRQRLQREEGFTLIELLVVIVIIGILLAIAVPSYSVSRIARTTVRLRRIFASAIPSTEAFYSDNGNYSTAWHDPAFDDGRNHDRRSTRGYRQGEHGRFWYGQRLLPVTANVNEPDLVGRQALAPPRYKIATCAGTAS